MLRGSAGKFLPHMALWFAQSDGPVTPSRCGKRCVTPGPRDDRAVAGVRTTPLRRAVVESSHASTSNNVETTTLYAPSGRKRPEAHSAGYALASPIIPDRIVNRDAYTHAPWENGGKRIRRDTEPAFSLFKTSNDFSPRKETGGCLTPRRAAAQCNPPFGTENMDPSTVPSPRYQKRHVDTPLATTSVGEQEYQKKRSRTPPAATKSHCDVEGFCVLYSSKPAEGGQVQYMSMVKAGQTGKSKKHGEKEFLDSRAALAEKTTRIDDHKRELQRERRAVDRPEPKPQGIRRVHSPSASYRLAAPYAVNLPGPRHDDVGISSVRAKSPAATAAARAVADLPQTSQRRWRM